jgi:hypothetical protein
VQSRHSLVRRVALTRMSGSSTTACLWSRVRLAHQGTGRGGRRSPYVQALSEEQADWRVPDEAITLHPASWHSSLGSWSPHRERRPRCVPRGQRVPVGQRQRRIAASGQPVRRGSCHHRPRGLATQPANLRFWRVNTGQRGFHVPYPMSLTGALSSRWGAKWSFSRDSGVQRKNSLLLGRPQDLPEDRMPREQLLDPKVAIV